MDVIIALGLIVVLFAVLGSGLWIGLFERPEQHLVVEGGRGKCADVIGDGIRKIVRFGDHNCADSIINGV